MAEWVIERLRREHQRADFSCGKELLDTFLHTLVSQYERRRLGRTFVATLEGDTRVAGYYTLAAGSIDVSSLPEPERKKYPKHPLPTVHIGRLAVDQSHRGKRLGETLLFHALNTALEVSAKLGTFAVDVFAVDEEAQKILREVRFSLRCERSASSVPADEDRRGNVRSVDVTSGFRGGVFETARLARLGDAAEKAIRLVHGEVAPGQVRAVKPDVGGVHRRAPR